MNLFGGKDKKEAKEPVVVGTLVKDDLAEKVKKLTNDKVIEVLEMKVEKVDKDVFEAKLNQAKLGMVFLRDRELARRIASGHTIRIMTLVYDNPEEMKAYIKATMPEVKLLEEK